MPRYHLKKAYGRLQKKTALHWVTLSSIVFGPSPRRSRRDVKIIRDIHHKHLVRGGMLPNRPKPESICGSMRGRKTVMLGKPS